MHCTACLRSWKYSNTHPSPPCPAYAALWPCNPKQGEALKETQRTALSCCLPNSGLRVTRKMCRQLPTSSCPRPAEILQLQHSYVPAGSCCALCHCMRTLTRREGDPPSPAFHKTVVSQNTAVLPSTPIQGTGEACAFQRSTLGSIASEIVRYFSLLPADQELLPKDSRQLSFHGYQQPAVVPIHSIQLLHGCFHF